MRRKDFIGYAIISLSCQMPVPPYLVLVIRGVMLCPPHWFLHVSFLGYFNNSSSHLTSCSPSPLSLVLYLGDMPIEPWPSPLLHSFRNMVDILFYIFAKIVAIACLEILLHIMSLDGFLSSKCMIIFFTDL
jgi:hypothetical protein